MQITKSNLFEQRRLASLMLRAVFGVSLMCVSSLGAMPQRALACEEESEVLEMRLDAERVRVRAHAGKCAPGDRYHEIVFCCRRFNATASRLPVAEPVTGHRLANGLVAPLVC